MRRSSPAIILVSLLFAAGPVGASVISVLNSDSQVSAIKTPTLSFDAGLTADKLVVEVSSEKSTEPYSVSYNGTGLTLAVAASAGRSADLWYLDNPYNGGAANLTIDMSGVGTVNGIGFGAVSLAGSAPGVAVTVANPAGNVTISPTATNSLVVAGHVSNSGSGGAAANPPLTQIYGAQIGSSRGAAGYANGVPVGPSTYSFSNVAPSPQTAGAAFTPLDVHAGRLPIPDLFATGVDAGGTPLADGTIGEPHYALTSVPGGSTTDIRVRTSAGGFPIGPWLGDGPTSAWIGANNAANLGSPPGNYIAETSFTVPSDANLLSILIDGLWAKDNGGVDILLNGNSLVASGDITASELTGGFGSYTPFSFGPGVPFFQLGTNTLGFEWSNAGSSNNPGGVRVIGLMGSYESTIPEPSTAALLGLAMMCLAGCVRRRGRN